MRTIRFRLLLLYLVLGVIIGSLIGEFAAWMLPDGVVKQFFIKSIKVGLDINNPVVLKLNLIELTFGFSLELNIAGLLGLFVAVYILRWYR